MANTTFYLLTLYRFGYDLTILTDDVEKGKAALMREYTKTYRKENGTSPKKDICQYGTTYYENAYEDIEVTKLELNKVEWR